MFIDTHCHLDYFEDIKSIIDKSKEIGVRKIVTIGTEIYDYEKLSKISKDFKCIVDFTIGIHPDNTLNIFQEEVEQYFDNINFENVIGIGEIGLDYRDDPDSLAKKKQKDIFELQLSKAKEKNLPVCIHMRNSKDDVFDILKNYKDLKGVFHCFCEDKDFAKKALDLGFYISFSGIVTFKNAKTIQESAIYTPIDRILLETDAPYLSPAPYRGEMNEPGKVKYIYEFISKLKNIEIDELKTSLIGNFFSFYSKSKRY